MSIKTNFGRVKVSADPRDKAAYDAAEENRFRTALEQAFAKIVLPTGGGGGGGDLTAPYIIGATTADLTGAVVVNRALGPDRVPATPNAMDDEMLDATNGYGALWTKWSAGSTATYTLDVNGGLKISMLDNDSTVRGIEQAFAGFGSAWGFTMKVCFDLSNSASNSYVGFSVRDSVSGKIEMLCVGRQGTNTKFADYQFSAPGSYASGSTTVLNMGTALSPFDWYYLRVSGTGVSGNFKLEASTNGVAFLPVFSGTLYPATPNKIGIFTYRNDSLFGNAFITWFRRTT